MSTDKTEMEKVKRSYIAPHAKTIGIDTAHIICVSGDVSTGEGGEGSGSDVDFNGGI